MAISTGTPALLAIATLSLAGCLFNTAGNPQLGHRDGAATDGHRTDGTLGEDPRRADLALVDGASDRAVDRSGCAANCLWGCTLNPKGCDHLEISNGDARTLYRQTVRDVTVGPNERMTLHADGTITVNDKEIRKNGPGVGGGIYYRSVKAAKAPDVAIFGFHSLRVKPGGMLKIAGKKAVLIYAQTDITVEGTVIAPPNGRKPGPGGYAGGEKDGNDAPSCAGGEGQGGNWMGGASGGGGGGGGASGGDGGSSTRGQGVQGGKGGTALGNARAIRPLAGGCGGGAGSSSAWGGGGGAALQFSANGEIIVTSAGSISAPGGGGGAGDTDESGGGGGSGGAILLEAHTVTVLGMIAANGGGGGSGGNDSNTGNAGIDGLSTRMAAGGGLSPGAGGGAGGAGGYGDPKRASGIAGRADDSGGGGGGAAGRIRINCAINRVKGGTTSPVADINKSINVW